MEERQEEGLEKEENGKNGEKQHKNEAHEEHKKKNKKKDEPVEELHKEIEAKDALIKDLQDKMLYFQAEFENFKKLKARENRRLSSSATRPFFRN